MDVRLPTAAGSCHKVLTVDPNCMPLITLSIMHPRFEERKYCQVAKLKKGWACSPPLLLFERRLREGDLLKLCKTV
jgi:hypothetical protein